MNYTAHLSNGGTVSLSIEGDVKNIYGGMKITDEWLVDDNGVMVNMTHVAALVPVTTTEEPARGARRFRDTDGEIWTQQPDGMYAYRNMIRAWPTVVAEFGPLEEVTEND
jgi:hypothetical protein